MPAFANPSPEIRHNPTLSDTFYDFPGEGRRWPANVGRR